VQGTIVNAALDGAASVLLPALVMIVALTMTRLSPGW
jgi:hypothetical protein